jgi:hypothetical protein
MVGGMSLDALRRAIVVIAQYLISFRRKSLRSLEAAPARDLVIDFAAIVGSSTATDGL